MNKPFAPDLIIETTSVCDRSCAGCYAPNLLSKASPEELMGKYAGLFLDPRRMSESLARVATEEGAKLGIVSFRGGEPSLHPKLPEILEAARPHTTQRFLETHGRWVLKGAVGDAAERAERLLRACALGDVIVKISFDRMHGLKAEQLQEIVTTLGERGIDYRIAITEASESEFAETRALCPFVPDSQLIFQPKAANADELVRPRVGVLAVSGEIKGRLNSKTDFRAAPVALTAQAGKKLAEGAVTAMLAFGLLFGAVRADAEIAKAKEVVVGIASNFSEVSSSGSNPYGNYFRNGVKLALEEAKPRLEARGIKLKLKEFDYGIEPVRVLKAAKDAVASDAAVVLGYNFSSHALLAAPIHQQGHLPLLTPSATANRLGSMGAYIHQGCFDNAFMGAGLARVARERLHGKTASIVVAADCAYCQDLADAFTKAFKESGGQIIETHKILEADHDFTKVAAQIKAATPDVILVPDQELTSGRVIYALQQAGINRPFLGGDGWGDVGEQLFKLVKGNSFQGYTVSHWHRDLKTPLAVRFRTAFQKNFGKPGNDTAVLAYDTTLLLVDAILKAPSLDRAGIEQALTSEKTFEGATGKFLFKAGSAPSKSMVLLTAERESFKLDSQIQPLPVKPTKESK